MRHLWLILFVLFTLVRPALAVDAIPAPTYFPVLPYDAPQGALPQFVPVATNKSLDNSYAHVKRVIIVIHDEKRDANNALASISVLAGPEAGSFMMIAPQFLLPSDLIRVFGHDPDKMRLFAVWDSQGWPRGDESAAAAGHKGISSFTVLDMILMYVNNRYTFPALDSVVIAGYGVGGNFVQRYAILGKAPDALMGSGIDVHFVVAGANSFLYPTANRPLETGKGAGPVDASKCPTYNDYPFGLDKLNSYGRRTGANAAKLNYSTRFVAYLNAPEGEAPADQTCNAMLQGKNSIDRLKKFKSYLTALFGQLAVERQVFSSLKDMKNDAIGLFGSNCGMAALFGDGICPASFEGYEP